LPKRHEILATGADGEAAAGGVIRSAALTGFSGLVQDLGGNPATLLAAAGLSAASIDNAESMLPVRIVADLLDGCAQVLCCPDFGMRLAERQDGPSLSRPLDRAFITAPIYRDAVRAAALHANAYSSAIRPSVIWLPDREAYAQRTHFLCDQIAMRGQFVELIILLSKKAVIRLTGGHARAHEFWFSHSPISPVPVYRARFGAPVKFGQDFSGLLLTREAFNARIVDGDRDVFRSELKTISARFPVRPDGIEVQTREAIKRLLVEGSCRREEVAQSLNMSVRTINRKLSETGKSFETLRDEVRRNLTLRYLGCTDLSLTEIAGKLGYSELAALSHSCQRWFDSSPSALRRRLAADHSRPLDLDRHRAA
jgi:AraC-like DNA-binding protein